MNRLTSGMVPLFALLLAVGCSNDPTDSLRNGTAELNAAPSQLFLQMGESKSVDVTAVDEQGNQISSAYEVTSTGSGITVRRDSSFLPVYINDTTLGVPAEAPVFRFVVTATGYGATSFTVSANGTDVTVPVQVVAQTVIDATISNLTPALGEVVTITLPAGVSLSPTSTVTFAGATAQPAQVTVAPDGKSVTFIPPPNIAGAQATLSDVVSDATPNLLFSPATSGRFTTPEVKSFISSFSTITPAAGAQVTLTSPEATFDPTTTMLIGASSPIILSNTGTTITFLAPPGAAGEVNVGGVILNALPDFALTLPATDSLTVGTTVAALAGTDAPATAPSIGFPAAGTTTALYDAGTFGAAVCGDESGIPCQLYKLSVPADASLDATLTWNNTTDLGLYVMTSDASSDIGQACDGLGNGADGGQEACTLVLPAGNYILGVITFGPFYPTNDPPPDWISLALTPTPPAARR